MNETAETFMDPASELADRIVEMARLAQPPGLSQGVSQHADMAEQLQELRSALESCPPDDLIAALDARAHSGGRTEELLQAIFMAMPKGSSAGQRRFVAVAMRALEVRAAAQCRAWGSLLWVHRLLMVVLGAAGGDWRGDRAQREECVRPPADGVGRRAIHAPGGCGGVHHCGSDGYASSVRLPQACSADAAPLRQRRLRTLWRRRWTCCRSCCIAPTTCP